MLREEGNAGARDAKHINDRRRDDLGVNFTLAHAYGLDFLRNGVF